MPGLRRSNSENDLQQTLKQFSFTVQPPLEQQQQQPFGLESSSQSCPQKLLQFPIEQSHVSFMYARNNPRARWRWAFQMTKLLGRVRDRQGKHCNATGLLEASFRTLSLPFDPITQICCLLSTLVHAKNVLRAAGLGEKKCRDAPARALARGTAPFPSVSLEGPLTSRTRLRNGPLSVVLSAWQP